MIVHIRQETIADFSEVYSLNVAAFGQHNEAKLVELLRQSQSFIPELSLVAMVDNKIVGHILFSIITISDKENYKYQSLALAPMAVLPALQKMGIGGKLINQGLKRARELGFKSVIVLGHEHYYPKFGFVVADHWNIRAPFDIPAKNFMAIELEKDSLNNISGIVEYPKEFSMV